MQQMYLPPPLANRAARRRGGAAAELALLLPVITFIFIVAIDFCRLFYAYNVITNCARNGALWASDPHANGTLTPSQSPYTSYQDAALADALSNNSLSPALTSSNISSSTGTDGQKNSTAIITVTYQFNLVSSYLGFGSVNLTRSVAMRVQPPWPTWPN
jgi:Flp pilus assembly protein TadG